MIFWRREPRFRKVVRPEEPLREVYCVVTEPEKPLRPGSPCREWEGRVPRLAGVWFIPDRTSKIYWVGEEIGVVGGTFLLYPATLRPGACTGEKGNISYTCEYPDFTKNTEEAVKPLVEGRYFRLRDDVEEVGYHEDRFGHPVYIVRNKLGETFRLAGAYARLYHVLRERGGWVEGEELVKKAVHMFLEYWEAAEEFINREYDELLAESLSLAGEITDRLLDLANKLTHEKVEELPPPGTIPADLEKMLAKYESLEPFNEITTLDKLADVTTDLYDGDRKTAFSENTYFIAWLALGLLVYEALIVEMGMT